MADIVLVILSLPLLIPSNATPLLSTAVVLFVIILCLLVIILAMKQNPVCDLSTPHSEALTVNILGEIRLAREQAKADHR